MDEIKRLTLAQRVRCNRLIRRLCANYTGGNCLPLDDGEGCVCVQMISYSLLCKYFRWAVLPTDKALCADRQRTRTCERCGKPFSPAATGRNTAQNVAAPFGAGRRRSPPDGGAASNIKCLQSLDFRGFFDGKVGVGGRFHPHPQKSTSNIPQRRIL